MRSRLLCLLLGASTAAISFPGGAGPLEPPAAPAPTQPAAEPRVPISPQTTPGDSTSLFIIRSPGSYYLTGDIQGVSDLNGITIDASNVTLDLMGFEVRGVPGFVNGIQSSGEATGFCVRNGTVTRWGGLGVLLFGSTLAEDLRIIGNGNRGLVVGQSSVVRDCIALRNASAGIYTGSWTTVENCTSQQNSQEGIFIGAGGWGRGCVARENDGPGFTLNSTASLTDSTSSASGGDGIFCYQESHIDNCSVLGSRAHGIRALESCQILHNLVQGNGHGQSSPGITAGDGSRIEANVVNGNYQGIETTGTAFVLGNTARGNGTVVGDNYVLSPTTVYGPLITSTGVVSSTNPWANFSF